MLLRKMCGQNKNVRRLATFILKKKTRLQQHFTMNCTTSNKSFDRTSTVYIVFLTIFKLKSNLACVKQVYNTDVLKFTIFCFFSDKILQHYKYVSARMVTVALDKQKFPLPQKIP